MTHWDEYTFDRKLRAFEAIGFKQGEAVKLADIPWMNFTSEVQKALTQQANEEVEYTGGDVCATCGTEFEDRGECKKCNKEDASESYDYNNIGVNELQRTKYQCEYCNCGYKSNESLSVHLNDVHTVTLGEINGYGLSASESSYHKRAKESDERCSDCGDLEDLDEYGKCSYCHEESQESRAKETYLACKICGWDGDVKDGTNSCPNCGYKDQFGTDHLYTESRANEVSSEVKELESRLFAEYGKQIDDEGGMNEEKYTYRAFLEDKGYGWVFNWVRGSDNDKWSIERKQGYESRASEKTDEEREADAMALDALEEQGQSGNPYNIFKNKSSEDFDVYDIKGGDLVAFRDPSAERGIFAVVEDNGYSVLIKSMSGGSTQTVGKDELLNASQDSPELARASGESRASEHEPKPYQDYISDMPHDGYSSSCTDGQSHIPAENSSVTTCEKCGQAIWETGSGAGHWFTDADQVNYDREVNGIDANGNWINDPSTGLPYGESRATEDDPDFENDPDFEGKIGGKKVAPSQYTQSGMDHEDRSRGDIDFDGESLQDQKCENCGNEWKADGDDWQPKCPECDTYQKKWNGKANEAVRSCPACNYENDGRSLSCTSCGQDFPSNEEPSTQAREGYYTSTQDEMEQWWDGNNDFALRRFDGRPEVVAILDTMSDDVTYNDLSIDDKSKVKQLFQMIGRESKARETITTAFGNGMVYHTTSAGGTIEHAEDEWCTSCDNINESKANEGNIDYNQSDNSMQFYQEMNDPYFDCSDLPASDERHDMKSEWVGSPNASCTRCGIANSPTSYIGDSDVPSDGSYESKAQEDFMGGPSLTGYKCNGCGKIFTDMAEGINHIGDNHPEGTTGEILYADYMDDGTKAKDRNDPNFFDYYGESKAQEIDDSEGEGHGDDELGDDPSKRYDDDGNEIAEELYGQNDPDEILGGSWGTPENTAQDLYNSMPHNYPEEDYSKYESMIISKMGSASNGQFSANALDLFLRNKGATSDDLINDLVMEYGKGTDPIW